LSTRDGTCLTLWPQPEWHCQEATLWTSERLGRCDTEVRYGFGWARRGTSLIFWTFVRPRKSEVPADG